MSVSSLSAIGQPIALPAARARDDTETARLLHRSYGPALRRVEPGPLIARGLGFDPPHDERGRRWTVVDDDVRIEIGGAIASDLVLLLFCDAWRDDRGERPTGVPVGWVLPVGEPLARVTVQLADGSSEERILRRRFEVNEGIVGWGCMAFLALPHRVEEPIDWRGPHARQTAGDYADAGHAGPLTTLPGSWGANQTGVQDHVPAADGDLTLWLHALDVRDAHGQARAIEAVEFSPIDGEGSGRLVVLSAITAFSGAASPLAWEPRRALRVDGAVHAAIAVDLGVVARRAPLMTPRTSAETAATAGWGVPGTPAQPIDTAVAEVIELSAAPDATLMIDDNRIPLARLGEHHEYGGDDGLSVHALPALDRTISVSIRTSTGDLTPARVLLRAQDGRTLPPLGHRLEVNPAIYEDLGADVLLGGRPYAYVDGSFDVPVPAAGATLEVVRGPEVTPVVVEIDADAVRRGSIEVRLQPELRPAAGRWVSGDTHVHFLAPSTALLQARAENVNVVHLLATQWGDHHTGTTDLGSDLVHAGGEHAVWVGSENRQNMLGHIGIVGTRRPVLPFASGGPPEGAIGAPVTHLMADWLASCREGGGLAIGAHFPLPMAEIAADIDAGLLDALEVQCFDHTLESPPLQEWYRYLDAGYRLPLVGGTDKMSAEIPLGQVRTWARLDDDAALDFGAWRDAVRAGRTFVTSGPIIELAVDGAGPGDAVELTPGTVLEVDVRVRAAQAVISGVELVLDGAVVAAMNPAEPSGDVRLRERVRVDRPGWIAARSRSPFAIGSAFASAMAAHTSAVYIDMPGVPRPAADLGVPLALVDGTRAWIERLAPIRDVAERQRFRRFLDTAERGLRERAE